MSLHELTDEQRDIRALAARFADEVIAPKAMQWDKDHHFPKEVIQQLGELGLMGVCIPTNLGGAGADFMTYILVLEQMSRGDAGLGVTLAVHTGAGTMPIIDHGSRKQIERLVPPLAQGHEIAAFALTEAGSGSDAGALLTRADENCKLTGAKQWVTNGYHAHVFIVFAKDPDKPSAFIVRRGAAGFKPVREEEKLGLNSSSTADMIFDETPGERLGWRGHGLRIALSTLDGGRIGIAAQAVGIAQAALDLAVTYAKERYTFGKPIGAHQAIQQKLADMQTEIEAARALTWRAARLKTAGPLAYGRGRAGQALRVGGRAARDGRRDPGARRRRLHEADGGRALLPRREGHRDLRGHVGDPAHGHRACAARQDRARIGPPTSLAGHVAAAEHRSDRRGPPPLGGPLGSRAGAADGGDHLDHARAAGPARAPQRAARPARADVPAL